MTASDRVLKNAITGSGLSSAAWGRVQAGLRDRAFFSARVEEARVLHALRNQVAAITDGSLSQSEMRRDMRTLLGRLGYDPGEDRGTIKDLLTKSRLDVITDVNKRQARGWAQHLEATSEGALLAFPAYELVRVQPRKAPRDWTARWMDNGGRLFEGRMIALKTDPIWSAISTFGTPYPPFDYNSGMGVRDVGRRECIRLGVIEDGDQEQKPPEPDFNGSLSADVPFKGNTPEYQRLVDTFGDQITHDGGRIIWRGNLIREAFEKGSDFEIRLGKPTAALKAKLPDDLSKKLKNKSFTVTNDWLDTPRSGGVDHRDHFEPREKDPRNIPLTSGDLELIPSLWRSPERVSRGGDGNSVVCEIETIDGGVVKMVVSIRDVPRIKTLYKVKIPD